MNNYNTSQQDAAIAQELRNLADRIDDGELCYREVSIGHNNDNTFVEVEFMRRDDYERWMRVFNSGK